MKNNLIVGVERKFKKSYLVTVLYQYGIHFKFIDDIYDAFIEDGIVVFIWGSVFDTSKINNKIIIITDNFFLKNLLNEAAHEMDLSSYFQINHLFGLKVNGYFMIRNHVIKIDGLEYEGACLDGEGKELKNSGISKVKKENVTFISYPFSILEEKVGSNQDYRFFYSNSVDDFYVEIGPSVDYNLLQNLCLHIFLYAFNSLSLPLVQLKNNVLNENYYTIRIDADGFKKESILKTLSLANQTNKIFNWYIDLYSWWKYKGLDILNTLKTAKQNVQLHSFRHMTYNNFLNNYINLLTGKLILKKYGFNNNAVVSPFGFYNFNFQKVVNKLKYTYSSEFGFNVNDKASFPNNDFRSAIQLPTNNASLTTLEISLFNDDEKFDHLFKSTVNLSQKYGFCILYEHPLFGIDKHYESYLKLINRLDKELEYISIDRYVDLIKKYYLQVKNKKELYLININWNEYNYFNTYNTSIQFDQNPSLICSSDFYIPYHKIKRKDKILEERVAFYIDHFKAEKESNFIVYLFFYFFKSIIVGIVNNFRR